MFYDEHRLEVREILRKLCEWKGVEIIEGEVCPDHVHILVSIERKERDDHISKMGKHEIRIPKPRILVQGILCGYSHIFLWTLIKMVVFWLFLVIL